MSMRIFNAYLYKDKADFGDIDKCIQDLVKIKKQYIPWIVKNIVNEKLFIDINYLKEEYLNKPKKSEGFFKLVDDIKKDCASMDIGHTFDFSFDVSVYMHNNKIVLHNFISRITDDFLKEYFKDYKDYSFYDYSDGGVGRLTKKRKAELEEIGEFYESLFNDTGIPSNVGLSFEMFRTGDAYELVKQLADALDVVRDNKENSE